MLNRKEYNKQYYLLNKEKHLLEVKKYREGKKELVREWRKSWWLANKDKFNKFMYEYRKRPDQVQKVYARKKFARQIELGKIKRQVCEVAGCKELGHGHHDDYNKPLEVRWLCRKHHEEYHHKIMVL